MRAATHCARRDNIRHVRQDCSAAHFVIYTLEMCIGIGFRLFCAEDAACV